ncbi:MAG: hypothetical protein V4577_30390 [Bacteroidota bacterium]
MKKFGVVLSINLIAVFLSSFAVNFLCYWLTGKSISSWMLRHTFDMGLGIYLVLFIAGVINIKFGEILIFKSFGWFYILLAFSGIARVVYELFFL